MSSTTTSSTYTAVDLSRLAAPGVVETLDYEAIFAAKIAPSIRIEMTVYWRHALRCSL